MNVDEGLHARRQHGRLVGDALPLDGPGSQALQRRELHWPHHLVQLLSRARQEVGERPPAAVHGVQVGTRVQQRLRGREVVISALQRILHFPVVL